MAMAGGYWLARSEPLSRIELAVEHCKSCGMDREWVEQTVTDIRLSGQSREEAIKAWEKTFEQNPDDLEEAQTLCRPCVEAVVVAALGNTP